MLLTLTDEKNPKQTKNWGQTLSLDSLTCVARGRQQLLFSAHPKEQRQTQTRTLRDGQEEGAGIFGWARRGRGQTLPDSLTAGRGEAMPWDKVEAAEKGSRAFSLSPIGGRRSRAEGGSQSVMNSLWFFVVQLPVCSICFSPFVEGCDIDPMFCSMQTSKVRLLARTRWIQLLIVMLSESNSLQRIAMTFHSFHIPLLLVSS